MVTLKVYNQQGDVVGEQKLNPAVFEVAVKPKVVQQVVAAQQANSRNVVAHTQDKSQVRGGGRKPWRQKGTGRARHGSSRSPIWRAGGVTFGPNNMRNFTLKINKKVKKKALLMALSDKAAQEKIILLETLNLPQIKTKDFYSILQNIGLRAKKRLPKKTQAGDPAAEVAKTKKQQATVLVVMPEKNEIISKSVKNISRVMPIHATSMNIVDVLKYQYIVIPVPALAMIEKLYVTVR